MRFGDRVAGSPWHFMISRPISQGSDWWKFSILNGVKWSYSTMLHNGTSIQTIILSNKRSYSTHLWVHSSLPIGSDRSCGELGVVSWLSVCTVKYTCRMYAECIPCHFWVRLDLVLPFGKFCLNFGKKKRLGRIKVDPSALSVSWVRPLMVSCELTRDPRPKGLTQLTLKYRDLLSKPISIS